MPVNFQGNTVCRKKRKKDKERKYFFSQKMVLWFILKTLDIPLSVPVLKNHDRGTKQIQAIEKMLKTQGAGLTLAFDIY